MDKSKVKLLMSGLLIGVLLSIALAFSVSGMVKAKPDLIPSPWDGASKDWSMGTVIDDWGYLYVLKDVSVPSHYYLEFGSRVYVQYEDSDFYLIEQYSVLCSSDNPIYGWIPIEHVLLDRDVTY